MACKCWKSNRLMATKHTFLTETSVPRHVRSCHLPPFTHRNSRRVRAAASVLAPTAAVSSCSGELLHTSNATRTFLYSTTPQDTVSHTAPVTYGCVPWSALSPYWEWDIPNIVIISLIWSMLFSLFHNIVVVVVDFISRHGDWYGVHTV